MAEFDVREDAVVVIDAVRFADGNSNGVRVACKLEKHDRCNGYVKIHDQGEYVLVTSKEHAENLKKALDKVIELGWLE